MKNIVKSDTSKKIIMEYKNEQYNNPYIKDLYRGLKAGIIGGTISISSVLIFIALHAYSSDSAICAKVFKSICSFFEKSLLFWGMFPLIMFVFSIIILQSKNIKNKMKNKVFLYQGLGIFFLSIAILGYGHTPQFIGIFFESITKAIYLSLLRFISILGVIMVLVPSICILNLSTKEGLKKLRGPFFCIIISPVLAVPGIFYLDARMFRNLLPPTLLVILNVGSVFLFLIALCWGLKVIKDLKRNPPPGKVEWNISRIIYYLIFSRKTESELEENGDNDGTRVGVRLPYKSQ